MNGIFSEFDQRLLSCAGRDKTNGRGGGGGGATEKRPEPKTDGQRENSTPHYVWMGII